MTRSQFPQFPKTGLRFLKSLKRNNHREWFLEHKGEYEENVRQPMMQIVEALALELETFAPEIMASPKASLYRIHRDTRFSKDKTPYKTHVAAVFPPRGLEKHEGAGFYLHITPTEFLIGGGLYSPLPEDLAAVRGHVAAHHRRLDAIVKSRGFVRMFGNISGEQLVRVPRGFPADHAAADHLRRKQFLAFRTMPSAITTTSEFGGIVTETFRTLLPMIRFLNEPILKTRQARQRRDALLR